MFSSIMHRGSSQWILLISLIFCGGINAKRDYCREYELTSNGAGHCLNGGVCVNKDYGMECECMAGFRGETCLNQINECNENIGICLNGATCSDTWGGFQCLCTHGFKGRHCEINIDDCEKNPCPAPKICVDGRDSYTCICPLGKYGETCEKEDLCTVKNPCNYGNCSMISNGDYYCECENGFAGKNCNEDVDECEEDYPCRNGHCENTFGDYKCHCDQGFTGKNCDELILHCAGDPCQNGGTCINRYDGHTCLCMPGYSGSNCENRLDNSCNMDCQNGGVCYNGDRCFCPPSFDGAYCEKPKPNPCKHGICGDNGLCSPMENYVNYYCTCLPGYRGNNCEIKECITGACTMFVDYCKLDSVTCSNRGQCINKANKATCNCNATYTGDNCEFSLYGEDDNSPTVLKTDVSLFVIGSKESVIDQLKTILYHIGRLLHVYVRIRLNANGHPIIYEWDPIEGKGELVDTSNIIDVNDKGIVHGNVIRTTTFSTIQQKPNEGKKFRGFYFMLRIDISQCLDEKRINMSMQCPEDVSDVAMELMKPITNKVLGSLGVRIYNVEETPPEKPINWIKDILIPVGLILFMVIVLVGVLTIRKKKVAYRDRNLVTASTWTPPKADLTKGFPGSMSSLNSAYYSQNQFELLHQNASTLTSLGTNGSLVTAPRDKNYHDTACIPSLIHAIRTVDDQNVYNEVKQQLASGIDVNVTDSMGRTPLMFAVSRRGEIGLQLIDLLVNYGADLKTVDRDGLTVLHISVESVDSFNERAALHLIQKYPDVDVNVAARSEETPLKLCARIGDLTEMVVRALLKSNQIDLDSIGEEEYPESRRRTALHIATEAGSIRIMELLLRSGAKLDAKDINEQTPLHLAAENMRKEEARLLINYGADRTLVDADNRTPEQVAIGAFWQEGPRVLNEPPNQQIEKKPADTANSKSTKRAKRSATTSTKAVKKPKTKLNANGTTEALLPTPSTMLSPSSDSCSPPSNSNSAALNPVQNNQYAYSSVYHQMNSQPTDAQYHQHTFYPQQQQTPELMNNSVCSTDSQTVSPTIFPSTTNHNALVNNRAYFDYNNMGPMVGYSQHPSHLYNSTGVYPQLGVNQEWYRPNDPSAYYESSSKVPSYTNGTNSLEFSPNSDQSMHNFNSPDTTHPMASSTAKSTMPYHQSYNPTIV